MDKGFPAERTHFFPGVHKIGAAISGPDLRTRIYGHEDFSEWKVSLLGLLGTRSAEAEWKSLIQEPRKGGFSCPCNPVLRQCNEPFCSYFPKDLLRPLQSTLGHISWFDFCPWRPGLQTYPKDPAVLKTVRDSELLRRSVFTTPPRFTTLWTLLWEDKCLHNSRKMASVHGAPQ